MNSINVVLFAAAFVIAGKWAKQETLTPRLAVGAFFVAAMLGMLTSASPELGKDFSLLLLVTVILTYGPAVFGAVNRATK